MVEDKVLFVQDDAAGLVRERSTTSRILPIYVTVSIWLGLSLVRYRLDIVVEFFLMSEAFVGRVPIVTLTRCLVLLELEEGQFWC